MNGIREGQSSTQRLLKSKYGEKQKLKYNGKGLNEQKKIMLADLCPEQKLKVGELIKINQSRKLQISQLNDQLTQVRTKFSECQARLHQIQQILQSKQIESLNINQQIKKLQAEIQEKDRILNLISNQNNQNKKIVKKINQIRVDHKCTQTEGVTSNSIGFQTKKPKQKNQSVQTQNNQHIAYSEQSEQEQVSKNKKKSHRETNRKTNHSKSHSKRLQTSKNKKQSSLISKKQKESNNHSKNESIDNSDIQQDQCFEEIAKRWMQVKQKKIQLLKHQYQQSKAKFYNEGFFHQQVKQFQQDQQDPKEIKQQISSTHIDDHELNLLLKSNNFSASRLLTSKGIMNESQNQRKKSVISNSKPYQPYFQQIKRQPLELNNYRLNIAMTNDNSRQKIATNVDKQSRTFNQYQCDLLELVDSLDK